VTVRSLQRERWSKACPQGCGRRCDKSSSMCLPCRVALGPALAKRWGAARLAPPVLPPEAPARRRRTGRPETPFAVPEGESPEAGRVFVLVCWACSEQAFVQGEPAGRRRCARCGGALRAEELVG
jgi:hypothetical protein